MLCASVSLSFSLFSLFSPVPFLVVKLTFLYLLIARRLFNRVPCYRKSLLCLQACLNSSIFLSKIEKTIYFLVLLNNYSTLPLSVKVVKAFFNLLSSREDSLGFKNALPCCKGASLSRTNNFRSLASPEGPLVGCWTPFPTGLYVHVPNSDAKGMGTSHAGHHGCGSWIPDLGNRDCDLLHFLSLIGYIGKLSFFTVSSAMSASVPCKHEITRVFSCKSFQYQPQIFNFRSFPPRLLLCFFFFC